MKLKQNVDAVSTVEDLRKTAKKLRQDGVLHSIAALMERAADVISEYVRKEIEKD